jgi:parvulin-like peptidyl-prolyl isomerase
MKVLVLSFALVLLACNSLSAAWLWGEKPFCTIDGKAYTSQDFKLWWKYFKDEESSFPESSEPFIDWQLLVKEAERMELYRELAFQRKVGVFLKVRSLLMLKNEEIDAKLELTPDQIKAHYEQEYCPQSQVEILYFHDQQIAEQAVVDLRSGLHAMEYFKERSNIHGSEVSYQQKTLRPKKINSEGLETVAAMQVGDISSPLLWKEGYAVFHLLRRTWFDQTDFEVHQDKVKKELRKIHEATATARLVSDLREKYHVQIDQALFAALDPYEINGANSDAILITSSKGDITGNQFLEQVRKQQKFFKGFGSEKEKQEQLKQLVLNNILSQMLTTWAALDRHYEKRPPLKEVYDFYTQHRLIKELEKRLFDPETVVSDEEVAAYYRKHAEEFTQPAKVRYARMEYNGEQIDRVWAEIVTGGDFNKVSEKYTNKPAKESDQYSDQLAPALKEVMDRLSPGEAAPPFWDNGQWLLVKLINLRKSRVEPLEAVAHMISVKLQKEKFDQARMAFLDLLKTKVAITVNDSVWQTLHAEMAE